MTNTLEERLDKQLDITFGLNNLHPAQYGQLKKFIHAEFAALKEEVEGMKTHLIEEQAFHGEFVTPQEVGGEQGYNNALTKVSELINTRL